MSRRIIAGTTVKLPLCLKSKASMKLHILISPVDSWLGVKPDRLALTRAGAELGLTVTPPLAGPSKPQLKVSLTDPWGVIQIEQVIKPVELEVIPRAKYAYWLAMKYLEQTGSRGTGESISSAQAKMLPGRGIEYFDSRKYQAGDRLKDIDWKHSLKLSELIIKEYAYTTNSEIYPFVTIVTD